MEDTRAAAQFVCQALILFVVVVVSLYNLTAGDGQRDTLWITLLSTSVGIIAPSPKWMKKKKSSYKSTEINSNNGSGVDIAQ